MTAQTLSAMLYTESESAASVAERLQKLGFRLSSLYRGGLTAEPIQVGHGTAVPLIEVPDSVATKLKEKVAAAKLVMGNKRIGTIGYQFNPRHSNNPEIYRMAQHPYFAELAAAAKADRERNPAFQRAQSISKLFAEQAA